MSIDVSKLQFVSELPIDKVVSTGTYSITNPGYQSTSSLHGNLTDTTISNPYGKLCLVRYVWSINGTDFYSPDTFLIYTFSLTVGGVAQPDQGAYQATTSMAISPTTIEFLTFNDNHSNVSIDSTGTVYTYTANPETFTFKYALYSIS